MHKASVYGHASPRATAFGAWPAGAYYSRQHTRYGTGESAVGMVAGHKREAGRCGGSVPHTTDPLTHLYEQSARAGRVPRPEQLCPAE